MVEKKKDNNTKRIHVLCNCYWGDGMSGGDRRLIEIVRRWKVKVKNDGYQIIVYTPLSFAKVFRQEGIDFVHFVITDKDCNKKMGLIQSYMRRTKNCTRKLEKSVCKGDFIYSSTDILPDVLPAYLLKKKIKREVKWSMVTYHIYEAFYKRPGNIVSNFLSCSQQKFCLKLGKRLADKILTTSPLVYDYLKIRKYKQLHIIDNAVDNDLIDHANKYLDGYDAVFLARLNNSKGVLELPEIWNRVTKQYPNAKLGIIGKGSSAMIELMKSKIEECDVVNNVDLLGFLESEDAYSIMKNSKIFLFTSHEEGWGMALAEAQLCGLAVVAYDLPIYSRLFEGLSLCPLLDIEGMAECVCNLLSDEKLRLNNAKKGRDNIIARYSLDKVAEQEFQMVIS